MNQPPPKSKIKLVVPEWFYVTFNSRGTKVAYRAKTHFFAPERYTAGILYTDSLNGA